MDIRHALDAGVALAGEGRYAEALARLDEARADFAERSRPVDVALCDSQRADVLAALGRRDEAAEAAEEARRALAEHGVTVLRSNPQLDTWTLLEAQAGPAGAAALELDGVVVEVDFADPATIVAVEVRAPSPDRRLSRAAREAISAIAGREAARVLEAEPGLIEAVPAAGDEVVQRIVGRLAVLQRARSRSQDRPGDLWAAEAARLAGESGITALRERFDVADALSLVPGVGDAMSEAADAEYAPPKGVPKWVTSTLAHARAILEIDAAPAPRPITAPSTPGAPGIEHWTLSFHDAVAARHPLADGTAEVEWRAEEGLLTVTLRGRLDRLRDQALWCRVFGARDRVPLALAPFVFESAGRDAVATLAVPRGLDRDSFLVEATDRPSAPPPLSPGEALASAIAAGQAACELERRASSDEQWLRAADAWETSAALWGRLRDGNRQALAMAYAATAYDRAGAGATARERVRTARLLATGWANSRLKRGREPSMPFVAQLDLGGRETVARWRRVQGGVFELAGAIRAVLRPAGGVFVDVPTGIVRASRPVAARAEPARSTTERLEIANVELGLSLELRLTVRRQGTARLEVVLRASSHGDAVIRVLERAGSAILRRPARPGETVVCEVSGGAYAVEATSPAGSLRVRLEIEES